jgi:cytoskeletal protein RodZ
MEPKGSFGPRLRQERERRQISLTSIAANTKISQSLLEGLERDDVSRWPSGIFRRSFVRSYATAIGLNADDVVREFAERFPDPADPPPPAQESIAAASPVPANARGAKPAPRTAQPQASDRIEFVFRVSVPRAWVAWWTRLTSRTDDLPRQQNT